MTQKMHSQNQSLIDVRGQQCPAPLIQTKKALQNPKIGQQFVILTDNETSKENIQRFLEDNAIEFGLQQQENCYHIQISKPSAGILSIEPDFMPIERKPSSLAEYVVCFSSQGVGQGPPELAQILVQGFMATIKEMESLPAKIILYNEGVKLALMGSVVLPDLQHLHEQGVQILVCGTCLDFFKVKDQLGIGIVSNAYDILSSLTKASHVVKP